MALRKVVWLGGSVLALLLLGVAAVGLNLFLSHKRADDIKSRFGHLVGSPTSHLRAAYRAPDAVDREAGFQYTTATGEVTELYQPYIVWRYRLTSWPLESYMRVLVDEKTMTVTRFRGPAD